MKNSEVYRQGVCWSPPRKSPRSGSLFDGKQEQKKDDNEICGSPAGLYRLEAKRMNLGSSPDAMAALVWLCDYHAKAMTRRGKGYTLTKVT